MHPAWFKLLQYNRDKRFGLTLPFLVGALRIPPGRLISDDASNLAQLRALLESMRDHTPDEYYIKIAKCDRLQQPVAAPGPRGYRPASIDKPLPTPTRSNCALFASPQYLIDETGGIDALVESLWAAVGTPISNGLFSFRDGSFQPFDERDLRFIRDALASGREDEA